MIAFRKFSGDIEHITLALFVMSSLCPSVSQFTITAAVGNEICVFFSEIESFVQQVSGTCRPMLNQERKNSRRQLNVTRA
jgi:hypothetical protein